MDRPTESLGWANRAIRLYRAGSAIAALIALLVANAIPIVGVAFLGWSLWTILVLYWLENGIVGLWNVPKIARAEGLPSGVGRFAKLSGQPVAAMTTAAQRAFTIPFFLFHYGLFWVVHGVFVFVLPFMFGFTADRSSFPIGGGGRTDVMGPIDFGPVVVGAIALAISHGVSFFWNYLGRAEYLTVSPVAQMFSPYGRLLVLHLTIVFGAAVVAVLGSPIGLLLILVVGKTMLDLFFHVREHRRASSATATLP
jgi:hypothetical protein